MNFRVEFPRSAVILLALALFLSLSHTATHGQTDPDCDTGVSYDPFGNMTNGLPGVFAIADTPANVRATPNGRLLFTLEGQAAITVQPHDADWYTLQIRVYVSPTQPLPPSSGYLATGTRLMDCYGQPIGHVASPVKGQFGGLQQGNTNSRIVLEGMTHRQNLRDVNWRMLN